MGCNGSKPEDSLPLVVRCRERRDLVRAAANHRYALAAAHVSYFHSLKQVGDALREFVDEELVLDGGGSSSLGLSTESSSSSFLSSPSLILPPNSKKKNLHDDGVERDSSSSLLLHSDDASSHLDLSSDSTSSSGEEDRDSENHSHRRRSNDYLRSKGLRDSKSNSSKSHEEDANGSRGPLKYPDSYAYPYPPYMGQWFPPWNLPANYSGNVYYLKKSAPATRTVLQEPPPEPSSGFNYNSYSQSHSSNSGEGSKVNSQKEEIPPPPPPPPASEWDFFNPFDGFDDGYPPAYNYHDPGHGYGSNMSSPDSAEVRRREGIPDLEEETEPEVYKEEDFSNTKKMKKGEINRQLPNDRASSRSNPTRKSDTSSSKTISTWSSTENSKSSKSSLPSKNSEEGTQKSSSVKMSVSWGNRSSDAEIPGSSDDGSSSSIVLKSEESGSEKKKKKKKKGVTFEVEEASTKHENGSSSNSKVSSVALLSPHGNRNLKEVVDEIRDEFEAASGFGEEVALILEADKLPYRPSILEVITSRMLCSMFPPKLGKPYFEDAENDADTDASSNLASTLDKLCAWEQKLYKEVKDEERLRVTYEKQHKKLKALVEKGAEPAKIDAARASVRRLLTELDVCVRSIGSISKRIHRLRDEELEPQLTELIHGLIKLWKAMLKCHQKQFQSIMESKMKKVKAKISDQSNSFSATIELERELLAWCDRFEDWIRCQKSYVGCLNEWLLRCLRYEPEPYSPRRLGAPRAFVICSDWRQALEAISEARVSNAVNVFARSLHRLWEKQEEEGRLKVKAECVMSDFERKRVRTRRRCDDDDDDAVSSEKSGAMKRRVAEEGMKQHRDAMKLVHSSAYSSLRGGMVPVFRALEGFTRQAVKAHDHVRLHH